VERFQTMAVLHRNDAEGRDMIVTRIVQLDSDTGMCTVYYLTSGVVNFQSPWTFAREELSMFLPRWLGAHGQLVNGWALNHD